MIALLALLACREAPDSAAPEEEPAFAPSYGAWTALLGQTWDDGCALEDDRTYLPASQPWVLEDDRLGFAIRDEVGYRFVCTLDGQEFLCDLPDVEDDFTSIGYDIYAVYDFSYLGTFLDERTLSGTYEIDATCEGEDCDLLTGYGEDFTTPCTVSTPLEATAD